ncbi:hypothetical protein GRF29_77g1830467 [Pseudopithomyces chartarum]|uniref:Rhodopsin domain-containing protein n=1 Tax=Pseudopithomyces chartarum TaxID=1892770 RepID=A0AAN6RFY1_9PLEO|nr:hypothetical protein GRF29_77g1830467 [Pseudopithomyces chartarum]
MFGIDDWLMLLAMTAATTTTALFIKAVTLGMGRHIDFSPVPHPHAFPMENFTPYFLSLYIYAVVIVLAYSLIKLSIGFFLLRLADRTRWRIFLICTIVFLIAFTISSAMAIIFQCVPIQAAWDFTLRPPTGYVTKYLSIYLPPLPFSPTNTPPAPRNASPSPHSPPSASSTPP